MENEQHSRFKGADWYGIDVPILIGGAGGTGSWLTFFLSRIGLTKIGVYDFDKVEPHNLGGQMFEQGHYEMFKVDAIYDVCRRFSGTEIVKIKSKYDEASMRADIMAACFDNMAARKVMFNKWIMKDTRRLFVDIRLDFEQLDVFFVTKETEEVFRKEWLYSDEEAVEPMCTMKQTSHIAAMAADFAVIGITNFLSPSEQRRVPFHQTYVAPISFYNCDWTGKHDVS